MSRKLPPLNALRAFEAAARHGSFTNAADELCVTPGAISRQVQVLEEHLGISLFTRKNREVVISMKGEQYRDILTSAFDDINMATHSLRCDRKLNISCYMTFALRWLMPRLPRFQEAHPDYTLSFSTKSPNINDVRSGMIDAAFLTGHGDWTDVEIHKLFPNEFEPVCSPEFLKRNKLNSPDDLASVTLLHSTKRPMDWTSWTEFAEARGVNPLSGMNFESSALAFEAASKGMGVAIGIRSLVDEDIEKGNLVPIFNHVYRDGSAFYLAHSSRLNDDVQLRRFRKWVLQESAGAAKTMSLVA